MISTGRGVVRLLLIRVIFRSRDDGVSSPSCIIVSCANDSSSVAYLMVASSAFLKALNLFVFGGSAMTWSTESTTDVGKARNNALNFSLSVGAGTTLLKTASTSVNHCAKSSEKGGSLRSR